MRFHLFGPPPIQPHADLVAQIHQIAEYRHATADGSDAHKRHVDMEQALRVQLAATPEHRADQAQWRARVERNVQRKRGLLVVSEEGPRTA